MTGAIERDDEIAAKARQGEWAIARDAHICLAHPVSNPHYESVMDAGADEERGFHNRDDVVHIVNLQNRFPLYRRLVEAVREWQNEGRTGIHYYDSKYELAVSSALAALDEEKAP